jgi:hypothetical protein
MSPHALGTRPYRLLLGVLLATALVAAACSDDEGDDAGGGDDETEEVASSLIGTEAAMTAPDCDADFRGGVVAAPIEFGAPKCAEPWEDGADNGGATTQGVTATEIKVLLRVGPTTTDEMSATILDEYNKMGEAYERAFRMWGRTIKFEIFKASGVDEAAERADAIKAADLKPFAVIPQPDVGRVFETEIARRKVIVVGFNDFPDEAIEQAPYRYGAHPDIWGMLAMGAEFLGKSLIGHPAKYADGDLKDKPRKLGLVIRDSLPQDIFLDELEAFDDAKPAETLTYRLVNPAQGILGDPAQSQEQAPVMIAKLKSSGVTSVMLYTDVQMTVALFAEATKQNYFPEWINTGLWYSTVPFFYPQYDAVQLTNVFGMDITGGPFVEAGTGTNISLYQWYWGDTGNPANTITRAQAVTVFRALFGGIHGAGPELTPDSFRAGLFASFPHDQCNCHGVLNGYGKDLYRWDDLSMQDDGALYFVDPTVVNSFGTQGAPRYLNDGKRYTIGDLPEGEQPFFVNTNAAASFRGTPEVDKIPAYPCDDCPSARRTG